jgi:putative ABC transport system permease protein
MAQAQAQIAGFGAQRALADPGRDKDRANRLENLQEGTYGDLRNPLLLLQGAVAFVLLIGCANVAGLLLARAASRRTEIAVRAAIGASRGQIVRQLVTETVPLAMVGGVVGVLLAWGGLRLFVAYAPAGFLPLTEFTLDATTLGFAAVVAIATAVIFGIVPALQASKTDLVSSLKETSRGGSDAAARQHIRSALVVVQIGLALVLLIGAGLMINSFLRVQGNPLGGDPHGVLTFDFRFSQNETITPAGRYRNAGLWNVNPQTSLAFDRVFERMRALPGVQVAAASSQPYNGALSVGFLKEGQSPPADGGPVADQMLGYIAITPNFFSTMRVPIVQGRDFNDLDNAKGPWVVIVNQAMAKRYWPDGSPLGRSIRLDYVPGEQLREVVGVSGDLRLSRRQREPAPVVYVPYQQQPAQWPGPGWQMRAGMFYLVRTSGKPQAMIPAIRSALADVEPNRPANNISTLEENLGQQVQYDRLYIILLTIFGAVAAVLAAIGIYGVMAYSVAERTREIGIRMALGARSGEVLKLVIGRALALIGIGLVLGLGGAFALARLIRHQLYEVTPTDPLTYTLVSLALTLVAVVACIIPTRRAVTVDPTIALRYE